MKTKFIFFFVGGIKRTLFFHVFVLDNLIFWGANSKLLKRERSKIRNWEIEKNYKKKIFWKFTNIIEKKAGNNKIRNKKQTKIISVRWMFW